MTVGASFFLLATILTIGGGLLLYLLVKRERHGETMDRDAAEQTARRDTDDSTTRRR